MAIVFSFFSVLPVQLKYDLIYKAPSVLQRVNIFIHCTFKHFVHNLTPSYYMVYHHGIYVHLFLVNCNLCLCKLTRGSAHKSCVSRVPGLACNQGHVPCPASLMMLPAMLCYTPWSHPVSSMKLSAPQC